MKEIGHERVHLGLDVEEGVLEDEEFVCCHDGGVERVVGLFKLRVDIIALSFYQCADCV